jgi:hypothetical protein
MASWGIRGPTIRFSGDKTRALPGVHNISPARRGRPALQPGAATALYRPSLAQPRPEEAPARSSLSSSPILDSVPGRLAVPLYIGEDHGSGLGSLSLFSTPDYMCSESAWEWVQVRIGSSPGALFTPRPGGRAHGKGASSGTPQGAVYPAGTSMKINGGRYIIVGGKTARNNKGTCTATRHWRLRTR